MVVRILGAALAVVFTLLMTGCNTGSAGDPTPPLPIDPNAPPPECELKLELPATIKQSTQARAKIRINNTGRVPVTLVMPGDGSKSRWRTPVVGWSFLPVDSTERHSNQPRGGPARCGNINPLSPADVFVLKPGNGANLVQWIGFPQLPSPGKYRAVFYYSNTPHLKWSGVPLGEHDQASMKRIRRSTFVSLQSNEVLVEITE